MNLYQIEQSIYVFITNLRNLSNFLEQCSVTNSKMAAVLPPVHCSKFFNTSPFNYKMLNANYCSLPLRRVHEIKRMYLAPRTHCLFIT
jgi:hypothetical protein